MLQTRRILVLVMDGGRSHGDIQVRSQPWNNPRRRRNLRVKLKVTLRMLQLRNMMLLTVQALCQVSRHTTKPRRIQSRRRSSRSRVTSSPRPPPSIPPPPSPPPHCIRETGPVLSPSFSLLPRPFNSFSFFHFVASTPLYLF